MTAMTILTTTLAIGVALASLWAAVQSALRQQAGQSVERALAQGLLVLALLGLTAWWLDIAPLARISGIGLMLLGAAAALRFVGRHRVPPAVLAAFGLALLAGRVG